LDLLLLAFPLPLPLPFCPPQKAEATKTTRAQKSSPISGGQQQ